jgi:Na+/H+ antiporter NhaD/arsenite permease-like protein
MAENESIGNCLISAGRCLKSVITVSIVCAILEIFLFAVIKTGSEYKSSLSAEEANNKDQNIYMIMAFIALFYFVFFLFQTYIGYNYIIKAGRKMNEN